MKPIYYLFLFVVLFTSCKSTKTAIDTTNKDNIKTKNYLVENIIRSAKENIGIGYKAAGTTKSGFDCSGLVFSTFGQFDIKLPRPSYDQAKIGEILSINKAARKGDLIFFKTNKSSKINHVGIITEVNDDEILFIHSSTSKGVIISSTKEAYYQKTFAQINRILE